MFMHYAFDAWMAREHPAVQFERYCDDVIVHARSERQARQLRDAIASRLAECGLELNEHKTRIVYCKDDDRRGSHEHDVVRFPRLHVPPAAVEEQVRRSTSSTSLRRSRTSAKTRMRREMRRWRLHLALGQDPHGPGADRSTSIVQGWINYYGRFYRPC